MLDSFVRVHRGCPTLPQSGLGRINFIISLVVEGDSLEGAGGFLDIRARSDPIIVEELRTSAGLTKAL